MKPMKELFKIERIRAKMPAHMRPTQNDFYNFFIGKTDALTEKQIRKIIEIIDTGRNNAVNFLNREITKLNKNGTTTSGR